jgi:hypothetical protein
MILRLLARALLGKFVDFRSTRWTTDLLNGSYSIYTAFSSTPPPMKCKTQMLPRQG